MTAMTSMGELGCLLESFKSFGLVARREQLAAALVKAIAAFGLECVVQLRGAEVVVSLGSNGPASPLDLSVIEHMARMERLTQFRARLAITYEQVSLLISNMPVDDADRCGRLRDHLAMLAEAAQSRLVAIDAVEMASRRGEVIGATIRRISETLVEIDRAQREERAAAALAVNEATFNVESALARVTLSDQQERFLVDVYKKGLEQVVEVQQRATSVQDQLSSIIGELRAVQG
jgi:hypothetical protein